MKKTLSFLLFLLLCIPVMADEDGGRKARRQTAPTYPEIARKMRLAGTVKLEVSIATDGHVRSAKVLGGHPVLANSAVETVKTWQYEPAATETVQIVNVRFEP